ncbi:DUF1206 domain-containing protein [Peribacillus acanthi]|uniref:DUF1206 domain-containing protein n=1 Tax=Peribacillus acanthi TaxID=2171554 RepID=UPI000D3E6791|nr:DUF1206 domain-containing protein [Peribacillus acanthi]
MNVLGAKKDVIEATEEVKPWIKWFCRFGNIVKGIVYILVGFLTSLTALGIGGNSEGTNGAFASIASLPLGEFLLWIVGLGLFGYVIWRLLETFIDPARNGRDLKGIIKRVGYFVSAVIHGLLATKAISIANHARNDGNSKEEWSLYLLSKPFGSSLLMMVGAIIIGYGIYEIYKGLKEKFLHQFNTNKMSQDELRLAKKSGKIGLLSKGFVNGMIGYFVMRTAYFYNPDETKGLDGTLKEIAQQPFGKYLLLLVSIGLLLYGVYEVLKGKNQYMNI